MTSTNRPVQVAVGETIRPARLADVEERLELRSLRSTVKSTSARPVVGRGPPGTPVCDSDFEPRRQSSWAKQGFAPLAHKCLQISLVGKTRPDQE